jgi:hypothetical protein
MSTIKNPIKTGSMDALRKSLIWVLKYSTDTDTHGWIGDMTYPKNMEKNVIAKADGCIKLSFEDVK